MKYVLTLLGFLIALSGFSQYFPVSVNKSNDFVTRQQKECHVLSVNSRSTPGASPAALTYAQSAGGGGTYSVPAGKYWIVQNVAMSATGPVWVDATLGQGSWSGTSDAYAGATEPFSAVFGTNGGTISRNVNIPVYEGGYFQAGISMLAAGNTPGTSVSLMGLECTADWDFDAPYTALVVGNSITWGTMGVDAGGTSQYPGDSLYAFQFKKTIQAVSGKKVHLVNMGFGGSYSSNMAKAFAAKKYDNIPYDVMFVQIGENDAITSTAGASFSANVGVAIAHRDTYRPNASIMLLAPVTSDKSDRSANLASYRTALAAMANSSKKIYYADLSTAYGLNATASADVNFTAAERAINTRLHPSGIGHGLLFRKAIWPVLVTTEFYSRMTSN